MHVPRYIIEDALVKVPKGFNLYSRDGEPALDLSCRKSYFGSSTASPNHRHALEKDIRLTTMTDIAWGAKVADALTNLDFVMPFGSAQDVPGDAGELYEFETVVQNTAKPVFFCGYSSKGVELVLDMAAEMAGGQDQLTMKPFLVPYPEPITPLQFPHEVVERIFVCATRHMPQITCGAIHDVGYMGMTCSCAMMVLGDEIISWVKRFIQGIEVSAETLATEVTHLVGPGGNYLTQQHTLNHMRKESWQPELFCKDSFETWQKQGSKSLEERADEKVAQIIENHKSKPLSESVVTALQEIREEGVKQLVK